MRDGEDHTEESSHQSKTDSAPTLSDLVQQVEKRLNRTVTRPDRSTAADDPDVDDLLAATDPFSRKSEFIFPADQPSDDQSEAQLTTSVERFLEVPATRETNLDSEPTARGIETPESGLDPNEETNTIPELIADAENILLLMPPSQSTDRQLCAKLLLPAEATPEHLLMVSFDESPDERLNALQESRSRLPDEVAILNVGDSTRSRSQVTSLEMTGGDGIVVKTIPDATDVQRIGLAINKILSEWDSSKETAICFYSLTDLLQMVKPESAFRFLNVLLGRVRSGNIRAHYHMDPSVHDSQTIDTYRPLFDETVRCDTEGSLQLDRE